MATPKPEIQLNSPSFVPAFTADLEKKKLAESNKVFPFVDENEFWDIVLDAAKFVNKRANSQVYILVRPGADTEVIHEPQYNTNRTYSKYDHLSLPENIEHLKKQIKHHCVEETKGDNTTKKYGITIALQVRYTRCRTPLYCNENPRTDLVTYDELKGYAKAWRDLQSCSVGAGAGAKAS